MKSLLFFCTVMLSCYVGSQTASAHVLITDETKQAGAILHVIPDDDPIAGQESSLFFDIQGQSLESAVLTVKGTQIEIPVTVDKNTVSANYVFPTQGVYNLVLTAQSSDGQNHTFNYSQRVSRGVVGSALDRPSYSWAEAVIVAVVCSFLVSLILIASRWRNILAHSKL